MRFAQASYVPLRSSSNSAKHRIIKNHHGRLTPSLKRDLAKTVFLRVMYGGTPSSLGFETSEDKEHYIDWIPTDFLLQFHKEFKHLSLIHI